MNNTWIVVPVISNDVDLTSFKNNLSGGYVAPESYEKQVFDPETNQLNKETVPHPYAGQNGPDFTDRIIFINAVDGYDSYDGVVHLEDFSDVNIYRYWNTGIEYAKNNGADSVILLNGVMDFDTFIITDAYNKFTETNKDIINIADGGMLLISANSSLRADDQFQIWFGDNDLYRRAEGVTDGIRPEYSKFDYLIDPNSVPSFDSIVASDEVKYNAKWS